MISVSIEGLKKNLAAVLKRAVRGEVIQITRHNRPVALLVGEDRVNVHYGARSASATLTPLLHRASAGRYLEVLDQDRDESRESTGK